MSVLALKGLAYGAEKIPDRLFEKIPGGFFTPAEKKKIDKKRRDSRERRNKSEQRGSERHRRRAERDRTPPSDYSDHSAYDDSDYERELRRKERRRRARSLGRSDSRSLSRGRHPNRGRDQDLEDEMDRAERAERAPRFDPPPREEYRPYDPRDYASQPPATGPSVAADGYHDPYDRRASTAVPDYGYPPQVNTPFRSRSATVPLRRPPPSPSPLLRRRCTTCRTPSNLSMPPIFMPSTPNLETLRSSTPLGAAFSPSYEPPLAALLSRHSTNPNQPPSATAARYTPAGYAPSPVKAPVPPPTQGYAPYNPADYAPPSEGPRAAPPAFYRQRSNSQPSIPQYPPANTQLAPYVEPLPIRQGSSASSHRHRHGDGKHHRARSAGHHRRSRDESVADKVRDRFENLDIHDKNLAASVGGALAGGFAGQKMGHGTLSTLIGAGIGAFGGSEMEKRLDK
jgi:hypothetical protein